MLNKVFIFLFCGITLVTSGYSQEKISVQWESEVQLNVFSPKKIIPVGDDYFGISGYPEQWFWSIADSLGNPTWKSLTNSFTGKVTRLLPVDSSSVIAIGEMRYRDLNNYTDLKKTGNIVKLNKDGSSDFFDVDQDGLVLDVIFFNQKLYGIRQPQTGEFLSGLIQRWDSISKSWEMIQKQDEFEPKSLGIAANELFVIGFENKKLTSYELTGFSLQNKATFELKLGEIKQSISYKNSIVILGDFQLQGETKQFQLVQFMGNEFSSLSEPKGKISGMVLYKNQLVAYGVFEQNKQIAILNDQNEWVYESLPAEGTILSIYEYASDSTLLVNMAASNMIRNTNTSLYKWFPGKFYPVSVRMPESVDFIFMENSLCSDGTQFGVITRGVKYAQNILSFFNADGSIPHNPINLATVEPILDYLSNQPLTGGENTFYLNGISFYDFQFNGQPFLVDVENGNVKPWYIPFIDQRKGLQVSRSPEIGATGNRSFVLMDDSKDNFAIETAGKLHFISGFEEKYPFGSDYFKADFRNNQMIWKREKFLIWTNENRRLDKKNLLCGLAVWKNEVLELKPIPGTFDIHGEFAELFDWLGDEILIRVRSYDFDYTTERYLLFDVSTQEYRELPFSAQSEQLYVRISMGYAYLWGTNLKFKNQSGNVFISNGNDIKPLDISFYEGNSIQFDVTDTGVFAAYPVVNQLDKIQLGKVNSSTLFERYSEKNRLKPIQNESFHVSVYPNPFNPTATIQLQTKEDSHIRVQLFSITGALIQTLFDGKLSAGLYKWPVSGNQLASGMYLYSVQTDYQTINGKMVLVK